jgi:hypothetical protein
MAAKQQTHAKRAREFALKERRERKRVRKAERAAGIEPTAGDGSTMTPAAGQEVATPTEWIQ